MLILLKGGKVYTPKSEGKKDILLAGEDVLAVSNDISANHVSQLGGVVLECEDKLIFPGFFDGHVHLIGGGGEGGFSTRTAEGYFELFARVGTTTIVGMLGTDALTRDHVSLLAKTREFNNKGLNTYMLTGSYRFPLKTITGDLMRDILLIPEVIGVGEVAISDHRGSNLAGLELKRFAMDARVAGMLSGKGGVSVLHIGDGHERLALLVQATEDGTLSPRQLIPTHIDRTEKLLLEGLDWVRKKGGYIDFTANPQRTHQVLSELYRTGIDFERLCVSSDGLGSLPVFDEEKNLLALEAGPVDSLFKTFVEMVEECNMEIEVALKPFTINPARFYKLDSIGLGCIKTGKKANVVIVNKAFEILRVFSKGRFLEEGVHR